MPLCDSSWVKLLIFWAHRRFFLVQGAKEKLLQLKTQFWWLSWDRGILTEHRGAACQNFDVTCSDTLNGCF